MKNNWRNNITLTALFLLLLLAAACNKHSDHADEADTYTCPMHPTVISDRPGSCPVCGMDLVRKARPGEEVEITEDLARLIKSPNEAVVASIKTVRGEYKSMPISFEAQGVVTYDTRNIYTIPARVGGRLEKVFIKYPFQRIAKGQKVAEIYSPELLTAQRELLFLTENDPDNQSLIQSAKERLMLLGATEQHISNLIKTKQPTSTFAIYSQHEGYVIAETQPTPSAPISGQPTPSSSGMNDDMGASSSSMPQNPTSTQSVSQPLIREGSYVASGQTLFKLVNTSDLRVELNVPTSAVGAVKKGNEVKLDFGPDQQQSAIVDFVQPFFSNGQEFLTIRVYTSKTDQLHIGHLVKAIIQGSSVEALWIPKASVLDLGVDKIVFLKEKKVLKPRKVTTGVQTQNEIEIKQGLSSSDEIAANAQYLIDSESFIKTQK